MIATIQRCGTQFVAFVGYHWWLWSRPRSVRKLVRRFPPNTRFLGPDGEIKYLIGYTEDDDVIVSEIDPTKDYDRAMREKEYICADCLESAHNE